MKKLLKRIFRKRKGVTILEGLISLGLLALVASGTFGVLLSISRQASSPDIREEMVWAVERAHEQLQMYASEIQSARGVEFSLANGLCGNASVNRVVDSNPLSNTTHDIKCMLPAICDVSNSSFTYSVTSNTVSVAERSYANSYTTTSAYGYEMVGMVAGGSAGVSTAPVRKIEFSITCNGFTL
ncbi:MAG: hypothetical protein E7027_03580 [Elusimicrobium sp.]|uniref:Uncharacterized protein n=1 Tax=Candidatus Avelusimicrobium gallicola TaxID=2562704 RepID=A0A928HEY5_9BACT|nr:hypothetical protein [Elusimicrobium sp.]